MSLAGKKFTDLSTGDVVEVIDTFEDITILQGGQKVRTSRIMDGKFYQEYVEPSSILGASTNAFAGIFEQIKSLPDEQIKSIPNVSASPNPLFNPSTNESAVVNYLDDPEVEKENLLKKYNMPTNTPSVNQNAFAKIIEGDEEIQNIPRVQQSNQVNQVSQNTNQPQPSQVDPVVQMFKSVKRINEIKFDLEIVEKLPRPDFMQMWEDSYELSIIDYLADEFTNKLLQDPSMIKEIIKEKIRNYVYPSKKKSPAKKPTKVIKDAGNSRVKKSESIKEGNEKSNTKVVKTPKPKIKPAPQKNG